MAGKQTRKGTQKKDISETERMNAESAQQLESILEKYPELRLLKGHSYIVTYPNVSPKKKSC